MEVHVRCYCYYRMNSIFPSTLAVAGRKTQAANLSIDFPCIEIVSLSCSLCTTAADEVAMGDDDHRASAYSFNAILLWLTKRM